MGATGEGSFTGDPVGYERKALGDGHLFSRGLSWAPWSGLVYQGL